MSSRNVGADQWRRTGVLTFDGNTIIPFCMELSYSCALLETNVGAQLNVMEELHKLLLGEPGRDFLLGTTLIVTGAPHVIKVLTSASIRMAVRLSI